MIDKFIHCMTSIYKYVFVKSVSSFTPSVHNIYSVKVIVYDLSALSTNNYYVLDKCMNCTHLIAKYEATITSQGHNIGRSRYQYTMTCCSALLSIFTNCVWPLYHSGNMKWRLLALIRKG